MNKIFGKTIPAMVVACGSSLLLGTTAIAEENAIEDLPTTSPVPSSMELTQPEMVTDPLFNNNFDLESTENPSEMEQVTSVSQLTDVQPTDWAFSALQSLVERYGCIEGYPDRTYRGNRAMTRYEFAAGLNQCLERITQLIGVAPSNGNGNNITQTDLEKLKRLQQDFATELAELRGRVNTLEARTTTLEQQQFSTTTKFSGLLITYLADAFGKNAGPANSATFGYDTFLTFSSSFSGKDLLIVSLEASNIGLDDKFNTATEFPEGRLSGPTNESILPLTGAEKNNVVLSQLEYALPIRDNLKIVFDAYFNNRVLSAPITPLNDLANGALSFYGKINPMLYPTYQQTGLGLQWGVTPWMNLDFAVGSEYDSGNNPGIGLFEGGYAASVRSVVNLGQFKWTASYINTYSLRAGIDTYSGSNAAKVQGAGPVVSNTLVTGAFYRFSPLFEMGASVGYSSARALGEGKKGDAEVWDYRVNFVFYDAGKKGNLAGLVVGTQPRLTGTSNDRLAQAIGLPPGQRSDRDIGYHIEAFYTYRITDNISITPGFVWLTAPNHDERNPDVVIGMIRTGFTF